MSSAFLAPVRVTNYGRNFDYPEPGQGKMVRQQLARICMDARTLYATIEDTDRLPAWVMKKVATAEDRLHMAADYIRYKANPSIHSYDLAGDADPYIGLHDGRMIRNTLLGIERDARYLASVIGDNDRVATWAPKFIYTAQDRLNVVTEYYRSLARGAYAGTAEDAKADAAPIKYALFAVAGFALLSMLAGGGREDRY